MNLIPDLTMWVLVSILGNYIVTLRQSILSERTLRMRTNSVQNCNENIHWWYDRTFALHVWHSHVFHISKLSRATCEKTLFRMQFNRMQTRCRCWYKVTRRISLHPLWTCNGCEVCIVLSNESTWVTGSIQSKIWWKNMENSFWD